MSYVISVAVFLFVLSSLHFSVGWKNRLWPPGFRRCLSLHQKFPDVEDNTDLARRMFVFFLHLWNLSKNLAIFLAFSGSFAMKNNYIHIFFAVLVANFPALLQNKNTRLGPFPWKRSVLQNLDRERTNQSAQICPRLVWSYNKLLAIIPRARTGSESIVHEAEGRMGYWIRDHGCERNNCFSKIQLYLDFWKPG